VHGADRARRFADEIRDELRVKEMGFDEGPRARPSLLPNLRVLGPRLGARVNDVRTALQAGDFEELPDGGVRVAGLDLASDDVIRGERVAVEGWAIAEEGPLSLALDTGLDDELLLEGRALDLIRAVNDARKAAGLELTDRIDLRVPSAEADVVGGHRDWIAREVLAVSIEVDPVATEPSVTKA
jgi:isoleucyl-tRNA synthetase